MAKRSDTDRTQGGASGAGKSSNRKPYRKPGFRSERVFETMALACGKISPTQAQCRTVRKNS